MEKIDIFGGDWCSYCTKAKELAEERGIEYVYHDAIRFRNELKSLMGGKTPKTLPQIFTFDGEHIGGYTDLLNLLEEDSL